MQVKELGICPECGQRHPATSVSDEQAARLEGYAHDEAEYFTMDEHQADGIRCNGSGRAPASLVESDNGNYLESGDIPDDGSDNHHGKGPFDDGLYADF